MNAQEFKDLEQKMKDEAEAEMQQAKLASKVKLSAIEDGVVHLEQKISDESAIVHEKIEDTVDPVVTKMTTSNYTALMVVALIICAGVIGAFTHKYFFS